MGMSRCGFFASCAAVESVAHGDVQKFSPALREGEAEQRGGLNIGDGVGARVNIGQDGACLAGGQRICWQNDDGSPLHRRNHTRKADGAPLGGGCDESAEPAGSGVVGMAFEGAGFLENLRGGPT